MAWRRRILDFLRTASTKSLCSRVFASMNAHLAVAKNLSFTPEIRPRTYAKIFLYQIVYSKSRDPESDFLALDNSSSERPDWVDYWPIRQFLLKEALDDESFYAFLSPTFKEETNLSAAAVREFVSSQSDATDVILLNPGIQLTAFHLNIFAQGDACYPGLQLTASQFFKRIGHPTNLNELVTHSSSEASAHFLVAKPRFWKAWLNVTERLFAIAESPPDPLGAELRVATSYANRDVQMKVLIMERIATWMIACNSQFVVRACNSFVDRSHIYKLPVALVCDALKIAHVTHHDEAYRNSFKNLFFFVSKFGKCLSWQVRLAHILGSANVLACLRTLASYWMKTVRS